MIVGIHQSWKQIRGLVSLVTCQCLLGVVLMTPNVLQDFCEDETFEADCGSDSVIIVQEARYGRMRLGSCLNTNYGSVGCSTDVVQVLDKDCSGRHSCKVNTRDLMVSGMKPCPKDLRNYLEAKYICLPACGSIDCPWVITAEPGQKIHLHLYDFDTYYSESGSYVEKLGNEFSHTCHVYVIIKEKSNTMTSCAEGVRERYVYTSTTNRVEIRVVTKKKIENVVQAQFMLKYTVSGCPDPPTPEGGWMERKEDYVLVGCSSEDNKATWKLTCKDKRWIGETPNCSSDGSMTVAGFFEGLLSLSPDMSIVVICFIALAISLIILLIGILCIRRKWQSGSRSVKHHHYDLPANIEGHVISNQNRDQHFIARLEHKSPLPGTVVAAEYSRDPYGLQKNLSSANPVRAHSSGANQHDIVPLPDAIGESSTYDDRHHFVEHIYESPTFARKDYSRESSSETSAKYFELEHDTDPLSFLQRDRTAVCHYPRINKPTLPSRIVPPQLPEPNATTSSHLSC